MKIKAYDIEYDTDGIDVDLPNELTFDIEDQDFVPEYELADAISDKTGFCVFSFQFDILEESTH